MSIFSDRLAELRKKRGLTQQQIADELSVNRVTYTNWEKGNREPSFEKLLLLAKYLETTTDDLLGRSILSIDTVPLPITSFDFSQIENINLKINKPGAPIKYHFEKCGVEVNVSREEFYNL